MARAEFTFDGLDEHVLFGETAVFSVCHQRRATHERIRPFNRTTHIIARYCNHFCAIYRLSMYKRQNTIITDHFSGK